MRPVTIEAVDPTSEPAEYCLGRYFDELGGRFEHGFDPDRSIAPDHSDLIPPTGVFLVGFVDADAVACGAVKCLEGGVGYIKRMWVDTSVRGLGLGRRMLAALEEAALDLGCTLSRLETNRALTEAIRLYRSSGYREVAPFNDEAYAHHWFEKPLPPREP